MSAVSSNPLTLSVPLVTILDHHPKFQFYFKKWSSKKKSYERRVYDSVDDKSLSWAIPQKTMKNRNSWLKGLREKKQSLAANMNGDKQHCHLLKSFIVLINSNTSNNNLI